MKIFLLKKSFFIYTSILILLLTTLVVSISSFLPTKVQYEIQEELELEAQGKEQETTGKTEREEMLKSKYIEKKVIALTFDDGPSKYSESLVDEMKKRNIPITFFILGSNAENKREILKFEADAGNEIAIHSYVHKLFTRLTNEEIQEQIDKTQTIITETTGQEATCIRVPYGSLSDRVHAVLDNTQLHSVLWTVDSKDWKFRNTEKIYQYVMKKVKGNDIILMHDSYATSINAAIKIVDSLQEKGYTFVTVSEFLHLQALLDNKPDS